MSTHPDKPQHSYDVSIVFPCLNENKAIIPCLDETIGTLVEHGINAEILIVDNGSTDGSVDVIERYIRSHPHTVIRLIHEAVTGYGSAYLAGLHQAHSDNIFMADLDGSYPLSDIPRFIEALSLGADMVIGNRFATKMAPQSMPWHHRYIGNPILSSIVRIFFGIKIHDIHCGSRALRRSVLGSITLRAQGMEFASEMIVKARRARLKMTEIPVEYRPRIGESKLNPWKDGWRHLRFISLYSPLPLLFLPGATIFALGIILFSLQYVNTISISTIRFYVNPLFLFSAMILVGFQLISLALFAKIYAVNHLSEKTQWFKKVFAWATLGRGVALGGAISLIGICLFAWIAYSWAHSGMQHIEGTGDFILALTLVALGIQVASSTLMMSILSIKEHPLTSPPPLSS